MSINIYDINFNNHQELSHFLLNTVPGKWQAKIIQENFDKFIELKPWCKTLGEVRYCLNHNINEQPKCKYCDKPTVYRGGDYGYSTFCSSKCQNHFRLEDLHYQENLSNEELKQILKEFCNTHHCSTWKISNKAINFCAKNIIERTSFLDVKVCFKERLYYINNDLYEIPVCPVCKKKHLKWLSNPNCYSKTCGDKRCQVSYGYYNSIFNYENTDEKYKVYLLEDQLNNIVKIGITKDIDNRIWYLRNDYKNKNINLIYTINNCSGKSAHKIEKEIHKTYSNFRKPLLCGNGRTEWFDICIRDEVLDYMKNYNK